MFEVNVNGRKLFVNVLNMNVLILGNVNRRLIVSPYRQDLEVTCEVVLAYHRGYGK